jgi:hypothetical protein
MLIHLVICAYWWGLISTEVEYQELEVQMRPDRFDCFLQL